MSLFYSLLSGTFHCPIAEPSTILRISQLICCVYSQTRCVISESLFSSLSIPGVTAVSSSNLSLTRLFLFSVSLSMFALLMSLLIVSSDMCD